MDVRWIWFLLRPNLAAGTHERAATNPGLTSFVGSRAIRSRAGLDRPRLERRIQAPRQRPSSQRSSLLSGKVPSINDFLEVRNELDWHRSRRIPCCFRRHHYDILQDGNGSSRGACLGSLHVHPEHPRRDRDHGFWLHRELLLVGCKRTAGAVSALRGRFHDAIRRITWSKVRPEASC